MTVLTGATIRAPDGTEIGPDGALSWAAREVRALKRAAKKLRRPAASAEEAARSWLLEIVGHEVAFLMHAEPTISIRYATGAVELIVTAKRWVVVSAQGDEAGTMHLGRIWSAEQLREYQDTFKRLVALLHSGPVVDATLDLSGCSLTIRHPIGTLRIYSAPAFEWQGIEQIFARNDFWELRKRDLKGPRICPNDERTQLVYVS